MKLLTKSTWSSPDYPDVEFEIRPLTMREALEFRAIAKDKGGESEATHNYLFAHGLMGWSGIEGDDGKALPAIAEHAMQLPFDICNKLAMRISILSGLLQDPDAEKNSQSPSPSSASDGTSTAETADGADIAAPKTPRSRRSGN